MLLDILQMHDHVKSDCGNGSLKYSIHEITSSLMRLDTLRQLQQSNLTQYVSETYRQMCLSPICYKYYMLQFFEQISANFKLL